MLTCVDTTLLTCSDNTKIRIKNAIGIIEKITVCKKPPAPPTGCKYKEAFSCVVKYASVGIGALFDTNKRAMACK